MLERPDADALLAGDLGQWLRLEDPDRLRARTRAATIQTFAIGGACVIAVLVLGLTNFNIRYALEGGFLVGAAGLGWAEYTKKPVITRIKGVLNSAIARALGMDYAITATPGPEFELAKNFELAPRHERARFEDCWRGTLGDQQFQLYEAKLEVERERGRSRTWETVFAGSVITLGFARRFSGVTLIERAGRRKRLFGLLGEKDEITLAGFRLSRVDMVDPQFADEFALWSNDQVEARYLVHPHYVERLKSVEQAFKGEKVRGLFKDGQLLILLENGNLFESGSLDAQDDRRLLQQTIDQFGSLVDLAARLNERPRTGAIS